MKNYKIILQYDGSRYKSVTDDSMYSEPISGYIERVG